MPHAGIFDPGLKLSRSLTERAAAAAGPGLRHFSVPGEVFFAASPSMPHDERGGRCRPCLCHQGCEPAWPYEGGGAVLSLDGNILNLAELSPASGRPGPQLAAFFRGGLPSGEFFGDFTLAAYDVRRKRLSLLRSASGGRPFYYCRIGGALAWASDIGLLRRLFGFTPEISPAGTDLYLTLNYVPAPRTIYEGLSKLRLGEELVCRAGGAPRTRLQARAPGRAPRSLPAAGRALREELGAAVAHAAASVPRAAVLLSGGLDSSSLVAAGAEAGAGRLDTVSLSFGGGGEERFAELVAKKFRTRHLTLKVKEPSPAALAAMAARYNEPISDDAAVPLFQADELLKEGFSGVITGTGGDELLGGHPWQPRAAEMLGPFASGRPRLSAAAAAEYARKVPRNSHFLRDRLYRRPFATAARGALESHMRGLLARCGTADPVNAALDCDMKSFLAEYLCMNAYAAFGRKGFKVLTPYLYPRVSGLIAPMPGGWKIKELSKLSCWFLWPISAV